MAVLTNFRHENSGTTAIHRGELIGEFADGFYVFWIFHFPGIYTRNGLNRCFVSAKCMLQRTGDFS
jgi:hypothetical protein